MLMEPDEYTPQERALTDKAKELIEQHELDWGNGVLTVVYILLFPLFQYVIIESCVLRNGLSVRG